MKAQTAFEYLAIVGIVLVFLLPIWIYVTSLQTQTSTQLSISYSKNAAEKITDTASLVFSQGEPAKVEIKVYIPKDVESINITNNTIIFKIRIGSTLSDVTATSTSELNGTFPFAEGNYIFSVEAKEDFVQITNVG